MNSNRIHEIEDDELRRKVFAKCVYEDGSEKEIEVPSASLKEMMKRRIDGEAIDKFQTYNKKKVVVDDIELTVPFNVSPWIYFGKRISAFEFYYKYNLSFPIFDYDEALGREITPDDLVKSSYIMLLSKNVVKNPEPGAVTVEEIRKMLVNTENNDKPKNL